MKEIWKDIPNYEGYYQASDKGKIKSLSRKMWNGKSYYYSKEIILNNVISKAGYYVVGLIMHKVHKVFSVHVLQAMSFYGHIPCRFKIVVDHIDNNKLNNNIGNLQLVTNRENTTKDNYKRFGSSKYLGVSRNKFINKWVANIWIDGKTKHLGYFYDELKASEAYQNKLKEIS